MADTATQATNGSTTTSYRQPDSDAIRMFVGQIPRQWGEEELNKLFEEFGEVYQVIILKERGTGANRGCCFVTYYTRREAMEAQIALHQTRILPGMKHPIQMKPADNDPNKNAEDRKLFVGMVSKKYTEEDVRQLFTPHGTIEECIILRDNQGNSKGCAFVQFSGRQSCINAIRSLNRSQVMDGCSAPLTVKFAETTKQKEMKKMSQQMNDFGGGGMGGGLFGSGQQFGGNSMGNFMQQGFGNNPQNNAGDLQQQLTLLALTQAAAGQNQNSPLLAALGGMSSMGSLNNINPQALQALSTLLKPNQPQAAITAAVTTLIAALAANSGGGGGNMGGSYQQSPPSLFPGGPPSGGGAGSGGGSNQFASILAAIQGQNPPPAPGGVNVPPPPLPSTTQQSGGYGGMDGGGGGLMGQQQGGGSGDGGNIDSFTQAFLQGVNQYAQSQAAAGNQFSGGSQLAPMPAKQSEGPEGANLFIYHLPQEYTDAELATAFAPFGQILSAKVFVDKQTNMSKCFGFVSYDNAISAQNAIANMNGITLGRKTLRVQLKRDNTKPY